MNFFEAVLVFVVVPLATMLVVALLTLVPHRRKARPQYRPGDPWDYADRFYSGDTPIAVPASSSTDSQLGGARGTW